MDTVSVQQSILSLEGIFKQMVVNYNTFGAVWKNIGLAREAFEILKSLPDVVEGEFDTPAEKASILSDMLEQIEETIAPRLCIEIREYMQSLSADDSNNIEMLEQLRDFIDIKFPMEEYCRKYHKMLKFDPVERTKEWEDVICAVETECAEILKDEPQGMGFCFSYWSTKKAVLAKYGIVWRSPSAMNPRVMFD